jgi:beta-ribofuranosylaminobenzene 5'-phosphate synthase
MIVETPSRIHISLIDMNASLGRVDGSVGLALEEPKIRVRIEEEKGARGVVSEGSLRERAKEAATKVLQALGLEGGIRITVEEAYPQHIGLGSGTQIALAAGMGAARLRGADLGAREVASLVGRGGTSGIGVAAFEKGGFLLDGGHSWKEKGDFLPSSASRTPPPPLLFRHPFPWKVLLVFPRTGRQVSGQQEVDLFRTHCPIPLSEVQALSHTLLMELLPALVEEDLESFGTAINRIQTLGFKRREVELQPPQVKELLTLCREEAFGAGLSSFGPTLYCVLEEEGPLLERLRGREDVQGTLLTRANHTGACFLF